MVWFSQVSKKSSLNLQGVWVSKETKTQNYIQSKLLWEFPLYFSVYTKHKATVKQYNI